VERASKSQPLVLILDNLHWADRPSLPLLEFLAQEFTGGRMLVVGTYRDEEITAEHPLTRVLSELTKTPRALDPAFETMSSSSLHRIGHRKRVRD